MPIPWDQIIVHGPRVLETATVVFEKWKSRPKPEPVDLNSEVKTQLSAIVSRLQALEETQSAQAELTKNLAEQVERLSKGLIDVSKKTAVTFWLTGCALLLATAALIVAVIP